MIPQEQDPIERALRDLAAERERDLRALDRRGPPADLPELKTAFLRQMEAKPPSAPDTPAHSAHPAPHASRPGAQLGPHIVPPGILAAALLLILGGIGWFQLTRGAGETATGQGSPHPQSPNSSDAAAPGSDLGPMMGANSLSLNDNQRIRVVSWEGTRLELQLDRQDFDSHLETLEVEIHAGPTRLTGPIEASSNVWTFELPEGAAEGGTPLDVTVVMKVNGTEVDYWKGRITRRAPSDD